MKRNARSKRKLIRSAAIAAGALMVVMPQPSASGETDRSFETSGSCTIAGAFVKTDPENVRDYLPEEFEAAVDPAGKAQLQIEFFECAPFKVDGRDGPPRVGSTVTVQVVPHPHVDTSNTEATWGYDLWAADSRTDFHAAAARLDYNAPLVKNSTFELTRVGAANIVTASVPWDYSPYSLTMIVGDPPPVGVEHTGFHYHLGNHGLIEIEYPLENLSINAGIATVNADPGSPLAEILGAQSVTTAGALLTLDFVGKHRLIDVPE